MIGTICQRGLGRFVSDSENSVTPIEKKNVTASVAAIRMMSIDSLSLFVT